MAVALDQGYILGRINKDDIKILTNIWTMKKMVKTKNKSYRCKGQNLFEK